MLVTSLLEDIDLISLGNGDGVTDPSKVFWKKQATWINQTVDIPLTDTICFDGRRDTTLKIEETVSKSYKRKVNEGHIVTVIEPGSDFHFLSYSLVNVILRRCYRGFWGLSGRLLASCENLLFVKIEPIGEFNLDIESSFPSPDQMYLYEVCCSVSGGIVPESLAKKHPGNISHAH